MVGLFDDIPFADAHDSARPGPARAAGLFDDIPVTSSRGSTSSASAGLFDDIPSAGTPDFARPENDPDFVPPIDPVLEPAAFNRRAFVNTDELTVPDARKPPGAGVFFDNLTDAERAQRRVQEVGFSQASQERRQTQDAAQALRIQATPEARPVRATGVESFVEAAKRFTGSDAVARAARKVGDVSLSVLQIGIDIPTIAAQIANLMTLGAGEKASAALGFDFSPIEFLDEQRSFVDSRRSEAFRRVALQQDAITRNTDLSAFDKTAQIQRLLGDNLDYLFNIAIPSVGSTVISAATGAGSAALARLSPEFKLLPAALQAERVSKFAERGAVGGNVAMNAAQTFDDTRGPLDARLTAAGIAALGTLAIGVATQGGAEGLIAKRLAGIGTKASTSAAIEANPVASLLRQGTTAGAREFTQELGENTSQEFGQQVGEISSGARTQFDPGSIATQAIMGADAGAVIGALTGLSIGRARAPSMLDERATRIAAARDKLNALRAATAHIQQSEAQARAAEDAAILSPDTPVEQAISAAAQAVSRDSPLRGHVQAMTDLQALMAEAGFSTDVGVQAAAEPSVQRPIENAPLAPATQATEAVSTDLPVQSDSLAHQPVLPQSNTAGLVTAGQETAAVTQTQTASDEQFAPAVRVPGDNGMEVIITRGANGFNATLRDAETGESVATQIFSSPELAQAGALNLLGPQETRNAETIRGDQAGPDRAPREPVGRQDTGSQNLQRDAPRGNATGDTQLRQEDRQAVADLPPAVPAQLSAKQIRAASGKPFKTQKSAELARKAKRLTRSHEVVEADDGFVLTRRAREPRPEIGEVRPEAGSIGTNAASANAGRTEKLAPRTGTTDEATGLPLNADGTVTVFHHTSAASAQAIRRTGVLRADAEPDVYVTTRRETDTGHGDTAVPIRVRPELLRLDDEFPSGRRDFSLSVGKPGGSIEVAVEAESSAPEVTREPKASKEEPLAANEGSATVAQEERGLDDSSGDAFESRDSHVLPGFRSYQGEASAEQALTDGMGELAALGVDIGDVRIVREHRADAPDSPMRIFTGDKVIYYNTAAPHTRAGDVQAALEELLHIADNLNGDNVLSAGSERLSEGGDLRTEIEAAMDSGDGQILRDWLKYPLKKITYPDLSADRVTAELFARVGVLYSSHSAYLERVAPKTKEAYDSIFRPGPGTRSVQGEVRQVPDAGLDRALERVRQDRSKSESGRAESADGARPDAARTRGPRRAADGAELAAVRQRIADTLRSHPEGKRLSGFIESRSSRDDVTAEAMRRAGVPDDTRPFAQRVADNISDRFDRSRAALQSDRVIVSTLDRLHGLKIAERTVGNLPAEQAAYVAARFASGSSSVMRGVMLHGAPQWRDGILRRIEGSKGLLDILSPVREDLNDWIGWRVGKRAQVLKTLGKEANLDQPHIEALLKLGEGREERFKAVAREFAAFKRAILDVAEGAGLIDASTRPMWDQADWIPFYRAVDDRVTGPGKRSGAPGPSSGIRTLRGGAAVLNDPLENIMLNFTRLIDASMKNHALLLATENLNDAVNARGVKFLEKIAPQAKSELIPLGQLKGILRDQGVSDTLIASMPRQVFSGLQKMWAITPPTDPDVIRVMRDGKPEYYRVQDELLLRSLTALIGQTPYSATLQAFVTPARAFSRTLTRGVTVTPDFMLRNFIRDTVSAQLIVKDHIIPIFGGMKGAVKSFTETGGGLDMMFAGASFIGGHFNAGNPVEAADSLRRALRQKGFDAASTNKFMSSLIDQPVRLLEAWELVGSAIENANREAVFEAATKAGKSVAQAAFDALDLMDFRMRGDSTVLNVMADTLPFFNARLQGLYKFGRAATDDSGAVLGRVGLGLAKHVAIRGTVLMGLSLALAALNGGQDWYEELEEWDKDNYWHFRFRIGKALAQNATDKGFTVDNGEFLHLRMPKPFELGVIFATLPERAFRAAKGHDDTKTLITQIAWNVYENLAFNPVPQVIRPLTEIGANTSFFTGRDIENIGDQSVLPRARFNESTSPTVRAAVNSLPRAADFVGASPKRVEHFVRGYFGELGVYALNVADVATRSLQDAPPRPDLRVDQIPLLKSFVRGDPPVSTRFRTELFTMHREVDQLYSTILKFQKQDRDDLIEPLLTPGNTAKLEQREKLSNAVELLTEARKQMDDALRDRTMTPAQKRQLIDELLSVQNQISRDVALATRAPFRPILNQ